MITNCQFFLELLKLIVPSIFIILGWIAVHKLTVIRELEKARRDIVISSTDKICEQINFILEIAQNYHLSPRDVTKENSIKRNLQDISIRLSSFKDLVDDKNCQQIWVNLKNFKQAITGQHFEDEHTQELTIENEQFELIAECELALKRALLEIKHIQFKSTK